MIIIDSDNYAASGIETLVFPGGEPHVKVPLFSEPALFQLKLRTWLDVGFAALLTESLSRQKGYYKHTFFIPYFPGARQDRAPEGKSPLTLRIMKKLLCCYEGYFFTFDIHSSLAEQELLADDMWNLMPDLLPIPVRKDVQGIIAPDAGAIGRATQFRNKFYPDIMVIQCSKKRDLVTGRLSGYHMSPLECNGHYICVDDCCDGGGTFNLLADAFKSDPLSADSTLELFVSHGIFSKGLDNISPVITHITTTDSWCRLPSSERLTVIPLLPHLIPELTRD